MELAEKTFKNSNYDFLYAFPNFKSRAAHIRNNWDEPFIFDYYILPKMLSHKLKKKAKQTKNVFLIQTGNQNILIDDDYNSLNEHIKGIGSIVSKELFSFKFNEQLNKHHYIKITNEGKTVGVVVIKEDKRKFKGVPIKFADILFWRTIGSEEEQKNCLALGLLESLKYGEACVLWQATTTLIQNFIKKDLGFLNLSKLPSGKDEHYFFVKPLSKNTPKEIITSEVWDLQWFETDI
jgi:hypothetical protein